VTQGFFALPGDPATRTGGYLYDRRILAELERLGRPLALCRLPDGFPLPDAATRAAAEGRLAALSDGALVVVDGLALGALPEAAEALAARATLVALVHHPLAAETGLAEAERARLAASERRALAAAARVIVTGPATARGLAADYGVPAERLAVVPPGTEAAPLAAADSPAPLLLCVATLTPRKGHDLLLQALAGLRALPWRLVCAGAARDPAWAESLHRQLRAAGLEERVVLLGEVGEEELASLYARADLFVLPSHLEGYGMALAEALARGLPSVTTPAAAIVETLPPDCLRLVPAGDASALAAVLGELLGDPDARSRLREAARRARASLPGWGAAGRAFAAELARVAP